VLEFAADHGFRHSQDLSSLFEEGARFLHMSIRWNNTFQVLADAGLTETPKSRGIDERFQRGEIRGVRFQPFYLPQCPRDPAELVGHGLFARGFHFPGIITPGQVSLMCICDACRKGFRLQSFNAALGDDSYFYCSERPHTLVADRWNTAAPAPFVTPDPEALARFEAGLPPCERCGGQFRYLNPLRCPHCLHPYIDFERFPETRAAEYYGNRLYGESCQTYPAPR